MNIFISYRRKTWPFTQRLAERLRARLGAKVFVDTDSIDDDDFDESILRHLRSSDVFVLVVSEYTFAPERINRESDWVRREIREALKLDLTIVLAMIDGCTPPPPDQLPDDIREITTKQGIEFYSVYFDAGVEELANFTRKVLRQRGRPLWLRRWGWMGGAAAVVGLVIVGLIVGDVIPIGGGDWEPTVDTTEPTAEVTELVPETLHPPTTEAPFPSPTEKFTRNADWTPQIKELDGVAMVLVPVGCFMMGSDDGKSDEHPAHEQCINQPFWIDLTEVTNAQYGSTGMFTGDNQPRDSVNWFDAAGHCENRGARLPTEAEWEYAARGPDNLIYPWGDGFTSAKSINYTYSGEQTAEVGSKPEGASWVGALDMSGNLWEWVSTLYQPYPYRNDRRESTVDQTNPRVLRGASWGNPVSDGRTSFRYRDTPSSRTMYFGFRCARDWSPTD